MKHLRAAWAQLLSEITRKAYKHKLVTEDTAEWYYGLYLIRKSVAAEGFEPVVVNKPQGWQCEHMTMTGNLAGKPDFYCGCELQPFL